MKSTPGYLTEARRAMRESRKAQGQDLSRRLRAAFAMRRLSITEMQRELALRHAMYPSWAVVRAWVTGKHVPRGADKLRALAAILHVTYDWLAHGVVEEEAERA